MLKFICGAVCSAIVCYLVMEQPEFARTGWAKAREQVAVAARRISHAASSEQTVWESDESGGRAVAEEPNPARIKALVGDMKSQSYDQLWGAMDESDFDRRVAASRILLRRADIPATSQGITIIQQRYLRSGNPDDLATGFSYMGLLAQQGVSQQAIVPTVQRFIERNPTHPACDHAVWALGETGSENLIPYFFNIVQNPQKYGPAARERAFCCLSQCGRYTPTQRIEMVPEFIRVYDESHDAQTQQWSLQALAYCAPGVRARSIADWKNWWARQ